MANFLEMFAPQWMEKQRALARQKFQAGLQQPEMFQTGEMPIGQMMGSYEKGYGTDWPIFA